MNTLLKTLIVWLILVAVPFQAFAAATTWGCSPVPLVTAGQSGAAGHGAGHDHTAMLAAQTDQHAHHAGDHEARAPDKHDHSSADHSVGEKCASCSACCLGASMPAHVEHVAAPPSQFAAIPFDVVYRPSVDLALPERPPSFRLA